MVKELAKYSGRRSVIYRRYGLDFFSAPIVVGEPCPGYTFCIIGGVKKFALDSVNKLLMIAGYKVGATDASLESTSPVMTNADCGK